MKKLLTLVAFMALTLGASAQYYVGGSVGFTSSKMDNGGADQDGSSFKLMPEIGYQLDKDMAIGVQLGYSSGYAAFGSLTVTDIKGMMNNAVSMMSDINNDDMKLKSFTFAPYIRYTMMEVGKVSFFLEGAVGYTNITTDQTPAVGNHAAGGETKVNVIEVSVRPGLKLNLSDKVSAVAKLGSLGYISAKEDESDTKLTRFGLDVDSYNILLGFNFHF